MERVSKESKKSLAKKLFQFSDLKTQQQYILQIAVTISKKGLSSVVDSLRDFLKIFDQASKCLHVPFSKPKVEIGSTK